MATPLSPPNLTTFEEDYPTHGGLADRVKLALGVPNTRDKVVNYYSKLVGWSIVAKGSQDPLDQQYLRKQFPRMTFEWSSPSIEHYLVSARLNEEISLDNEVLSRREMYLKVLDMSPSHPEAYLGLAQGMDAKETVTIHQSSTPSETCF
jgi:hypothetical protein